MCALAQAGSYRCTGPQGVYYSDKPCIAQQGSTKLGGFGPAPEGMAIWIIGMVAVIGVALWIGARA